MSLLEKIQGMKMPFAELKARSLINEKALAADTDPDFSRRIREGLPPRPPLLKHRLLFLSCLLLTCSSLLIVEVLGQQLGIPLDCREVIEQRQRARWISLRGLQVSDSFELFLQSVALVAMSEQSGAQPRKGLAQ